MDLYTINRIKTDPNLYQYLRQHSYWYKYLNRSSSNIKYLEEEMKKAYKLTTQDKIKNLSRNISLISTFFDVLK